MFNKSLQIISIVVILFHLNCLWAIPIGNHHNGDDPELTGGWLEGDMIVPQTKNGLISPANRWPSLTVHYKFLGNFDSTHRVAILDAIRTLEYHTCLRFVEANATQRFYVGITSKPGGCYSAVGYQKRVQEMNLELYPIGEGCFRPGTILHEFMHVLGFYHEQSSSDRDNYVEIKFDNIQDGKEFNFKKFDPSIVTDFDVGYDYNSCLHYRPSAFSKNGLDTIIPLERNAQIGQRLALSRKDIDKINIMYKCIILL